MSPRKMSLTPIGAPPEAEDSATVGHSIHRQCKTQEKRERVTISTLPDDALLEIFDFYRRCPHSYAACCFTSNTCTMKVWKPLLDVCRRWRYVIFESSRRLHLRLECHDRIPTRKLLDIWPPLPITIYCRPDDVTGEENVIAALEHRNRVTSITLVSSTTSVLERLCTMMQDDFPSLTSLGLELFSRTGAAPALPEAFLGASAPHLEYLFLSHIAYPALPKLVSSATRLVFLSLGQIPHDGYISPEVMADCLAASPSLQRVIIKFQSPRSRPRHGNPPPLTRVVLPALTRFEFQGVGEYLEGLVSRIDAPLLNSLRITFLTDITFGIPQLCDFIVRSEIIKSWNCTTARVYLSHSTARVDVTPLVDLELTCDTFYQGLSWTVQLCNQLSPLLCHMENLEIRGPGTITPEEEFQEDTVSSLCLGIFRPFAAVQNLDASVRMGPLVALALRGLAGERATEVLPALRWLIFVVGPSPPPQEVMAQFIAARNLQVMLLPYVPGS